jgi:uncharacterized RDD family membrane protein YckC
MRIGDNTFTISTSQNVSISYDPAGVGERILASIIDILIKTGYLFVVLFIAYLLAQIGTGPALYILIFVLCLPLFLYTLLFETFMQGQTPGKKSRKIKVVKIDGEQAGFSAFLIRWLFLFIDMHIFYGMIGIMAISANKKGQRVGDMVAQTTVIRIGDTTSLRDTIYEKLNQTHEVRYQEAKKLTAEEVQLIKKVLNTAEYRENYEMVYNLTNKIQAKMNVLRSEPSPEEFLRTVVKDYNFLVDG